MTNIGIQFFGGRGAGAGKGSGGGNNGYTSEIRKVKRKK